MLTINQPIFFAGYRKAFEHGLPQEQVDDLVYVINKLDNSEKITGEIVDIYREKCAAVFTTIYHETAHTWDPITEMGTMRYLTNKYYWPFIGRGFVQLTHRANYIKFGNFLGIDLVNNPHLANEPENAWRILEEGMTRNTEVKRIDDPNFTAFTLEDVFNETTYAEKNRIQRFINSRRIINGTDRAVMLADVCNTFYGFIQFNEAA